jgi:hypothetical protein
MIIKHLFQPYIFYKRNWIKKVELILSFLALLHSSSLPAYAYITKINGSNIRRSITTFEFINKERKKSNLCIKDSNLHGIKVPSAPAPQETLTEEM